LTTLRCWCDVSPMKTIALLAVLFAGSAFAMPLDGPDAAEWDRRCSDLKARNAQRATEDAIRESASARDNTPAVTTYYKIGPGVWQGGGTTYYKTGYGVVTAVGP